MQKSWKTTLGGALSALGKTLMGIGVVPQLSGEPKPFLTYVAVAGFVLDALGSFFAHLFAVDQGALIDALKKVGTDTTRLEKP